MPEMTYTQEELDQAVSQATQAMDALVLELRTELIKAARPAPEHEAEKAPTPEPPSY